MDTNVAVEGDELHFINSSETRPVFSLSNISKKAKHDVTDKGHFDWAAILNCLMTESMWSLLLKGKMKNIRPPGHKAAACNQTAENFSQISHQLFG